ncbi:TolB family protein [Methanosarcina acetivorans]|nr:TolB family protein [Methanosarcina acetivorans]
MFNKQIPLTLMFIALVCISFQPVSASDSLNQTNVSVVSDLNQTVGKNIIGLVDTNRLEIGNKPVFDIIWSPDGSHMLINVVVNVYPKGKPDLYGCVGALYAANTDGSGIKRIAWAEFISSRGGITINPPLWSQSGDYFAYVEWVKGRMYKIKSVNLYVMSKDLNLIQKVELDPKVTGLESDLANFKWSPIENKFAALVPGEIVIYDLDEKNELNFSISGDDAEITDMEWSPDGKKIVFLKNGQDIIALDIENGEFNQIYSAKYVGMYGEKWSTDSKRLIFYEIKTSEKVDDVSYDIYVADEDLEKPVKITTFTSGSSRVIQWYPDSEKILVKKCSDDSCALYSLSITGKMKKLIKKDKIIDGMVAPNGYISATSLNPNSTTPPYIRTYDLFLLNESDRLTIENVPYYTWEGADVLFATDYKLSVLNTSTHDTWDIPLPSKNFDRLSLDPSGRFVAVDNIIFEIHEQGTHTQISAKNYTNSTASETAIIKKDMDEHSKIDTTEDATANTSELPGFPAIIALMGVLIVFVCIHMEK